jgi:hypothetical protein
VDELAVTEVTDVGGGVGAEVSQEQETADVGHEFSFSSF